MNRAKTAKMRRHLDKEGLTREGVGKPACPHCGKTTKPNDSFAPFCSQGCATQWAMERIHDYDFCPACGTWEEDARVEGCSQCGWSDDEE